MTSIYSFLLFLIVSATLSSSQSLQSLRSLSKTTSNKHQFSKANSSGFNKADELFLDGCTAILEGLDDIYSTDESFEHFFAKWENQNPDGPFLGYFDNPTGMISKLWTGYPGDYDWVFDLKFYDGNYIDRKFAQVIEIYVDAERRMSVLQSNGTFKQENLILTFEYGENNNVQFQKNVSGELSMFFMNKDTLEPISKFDEYNSNVQSDSLQIMFVSNDNKISFKTTLFTNMYDMSTFDNTLVYLFAVIYLIFSLISWHTDSLGNKVSIGSMQAVFASSSFVLCWMFFAPYYYGLPYFILVLPVLLDFIKNQFHFDQ